MEFSEFIKSVFISFAAGVAVSFTPCVYPVMPITVSFFGSINPRGSHLRGFFISFIYVFGIAISYCLMAVIAIFSGKYFGYFQNTFISNLIVGVVFILFSLVMFEKITIPTINLSFQNKIRKRNIWTVVLFGMAAGLVIGPCTAPVLGTLLLHIGEKQDLALGIMLMFVFSYGVGFSLIILGTFSGLLKKLPKAGKWMIWVEDICGAVILLLGLFYLYKAFSLLLR